MDIEDRQLEIRKERKRQLNRLSSKIYRRKLNRKLQFFQKLLGECQDCAEKYRRQFSGQNQEEIIHEAINQDKEEFIREERVEQENIFNVLNLSLIFLFIIVICFISCKEQYRFERRLMITAQSLTNLNKDKQIQMNSIVSQNVVKNQDCQQTIHQIRKRSQVFRSINFGVRVKSPQYVYQNVEKVISSKKIKQKLINANTQCINQKAKLQLDTNTSASNSQYSRDYLFVYNEEQNKIVRSFYLGAECINRYVERTIIHMINNLQNKKNSLEIQLSNTYSEGEKARIYRQVNQINLNVQSYQQMMITIHKYILQSLNLFSQFTLNFKAMILSMKNQITLITDL